MSVFLCVLLSLIANYQYIISGETLLNMQRTTEYLGDPLYITVKSVLFYIILVICIFVIIMRIRKSKSIKIGNNFALTLYGLHIICLLYSLFLFSIDRKVYWEYVISSGIILVLINLTFVIVFLRFKVKEWTR